MHLGVSIPFCHSQACVPNKPCHIGTKVGIQTVCRLNGDLGDLGMDRLVRTVHINGLFLLGSRDPVPSFSHLLWLSQKLLQLYTFIIHPILLIVTKVNSADE